MLEQTRYEKMFSSPFMRFQVDDHETLNAALLAEAAKLRQNDPGVDKSNRGGWHSKGNLFENDAACVQQVRDLARNAVEEITEKIKAKAEPGSLALKLYAWMNVNPSGGYNAPHTHPGAHWSGVYYVAQPQTEAKSSGMIEFLDPRCDLPHWRILEAAPFRGKRNFRPSAGELIIFPSYLVHWVHPNDTAEERVSIAFNATFRKQKKTG